MPTYAYACSACEHAFDVHQSFSDDPLTTCPACARESLRKVFSPVGVVFKGSGFYRNDSRAAGRAKPRSDSSAGTTPSAEKGPGEKSPGEKPSGEKASGASAPKDAAASSGGGATGARARSSGGAAAAS